MMTNPLFANFEELLLDEESSDTARAIEQIDFAMEHEKPEFIVSLLEAVALYINDYYDDPGMAQKLIRELF